MHHLTQVHTSAAHFQGFLNIITWNHNFFQKDSVSNKPENWFEIKTMNASWAITATANRFLRLQADVDDYKSIGRIQASVDDFHDYKSILTITSQFRWLQAYFYNYKPIKTTTNDL